MTDIDPRCDIELSQADGHLAVRVPLTGQVTREWLQRYQQLALASDVAADARADQGRTWLVVRVRTGGDQAEVAAVLDAARALIAEADVGKADTAADRQPAPAQAEATVRGWWAVHRESAGGSLAAGIAPAGPRAERRWPMACTLILALAVPLVLPARFSIGPKWAVPAVEALLLVAIVAIDRGRIDRRSAAGRALSLILVAVLVADAAGVTGRLLADLVEGGPETNSARELLQTGLLVWLYTIAAFAFLYWVLDGGGPESRFLAPPEFVDLAFPQQLSPGAGRPGWRPEFFDYLYLGFTNATAFSPTDVMPLARWAKLAMAVQSVGSVAILGLVIARAVNILK